MKREIFFKPLLLIVTLSMLNYAANAQNVGIGTNSPSAKLHVNGSFRLSNGTEGVGKVLTSDANGAATWQPIQSSSGPSATAGFGTWGDCSASNISGYNPVLPSDNKIGDGFGYTVSIDGDRAIVGTNAEIGVGKAYYYRYNGTTWIEQQLLASSDLTPGDYFGTSISISGNYAIIGAPNKKVGDNFSQGKAYIFFFNGSTWIEQAVLIANDGALGDLFGSSVSIHGNTAAVGARTKTVNGNSSQGKAYIFQFNGNAWVQQGTGITSSDGAANDRFGETISISGSNVVVGAPRKTIGGRVSQGKAYIFNNSGSNWVQVGTGLVLQDGAEGDVFGRSLSISGNYVVIGASRTVGGKVGQGTAYLYWYNGSTWVTHDVWIAPDGAPGDYFGYSVNISGNYAIVGARNKTVGPYEQQGSCYIFQNLNGVWLVLQKVTNPGGRANENFGVSVGISGTRFLIGALKGIAFFGKLAL